MGDDLQRFLQAEELKQAAFDRATTPKDEREDTSAPLAEYFETTEEASPDIATALARLGQRGDHSGAQTDLELVELWLGTKQSENTCRAYAKDAEAFLAFLGPGRGLRGAKVVDLQGWADSLEGSAATRARRISAVKSLLAFGNKTGYLPFNIGTVVSIPKSPDELAERILTEHEVGLLLAAASKPRDQAMVALLYLSGARISEVLALTWRQIHVDEKDGTASVSLHGKGDKTRHVRIPPAAVQALENIRPIAPDNDQGTPDKLVFVSAKGKPLDDRNVRRTFSSLGKRAGLPKLSPHWLRHAHASHALDRGAPIHLVQQTLGHSSVSTTGRYLHVKPGQSSGQFLPYSNDQAQKPAPEPPQPVKAEATPQRAQPRPEPAQDGENALEELRDSAIVECLAQGLTPGGVSNLCAEDLFGSNPPLFGSALKATQAWLMSTGYDIGPVFRAIRPDGQAEVTGLTPRQIARIAKGRTKNQDKPR